MSICLDISEFICVICREILINPVTLPCKHTACCDCLEKTLNHNKYQCFLCRKFIGSWYRNAKRKNQLINDVLWNLINKNYADLVNMKLNGESLDIYFSENTMRISSPGEIREEFEESFQKINKVYEMKKESENKLSEEFIRKLNEEERKLKQKEKEILKLDEQIAKELASEINSYSIFNHDSQQIQLLADEELAKELALKEQNSISEVSKQQNLIPKNPTIRSNSYIQHQKSKYSRGKSVVVGPMDRFLGRCKRKIP